MLKHENNKTHLLKKEQNNGLFLVIWHTGWL